MRAYANINPNPFPFKSAQKYQRESASLDNSIQRRGNKALRNITLIICACISLLLSTKTNAQDKLGYKGSIELGYTYLANSDVRESWRSAPSISTTQGYQFTPWFYAGLGITAQMFTSEPIEMLFPIHLDLRFSLPVQNRCKPYFDLRIAKDVSWHLLPSIGYRVPIYKDRAMLFYVGVNIWKKYFEFKDAGALLGPCVRIGFEW